MNLLTRQELADWLDELADRQTLIAPREAGGVLLYRPVENSTQVAWDYGRPLLSVKEAFFPSTERLLSIDRIGAEIELSETLPEGQQVIFGVRPCDARGMRALDAPFLETDPVDAYYARRREKTTLIGLACREMGETCFCTRVGGAPDDPRDMDVMVTETDEGYAIQVITEKGRELAAGLGFSSKDLETSSIPENLPSEPRSEAYDLGSINWPMHFKDEYWADMAERCLSCRICAYVCPTCRCFDVRDEALPAKNGRQAYERIRCWDSCASEAYRRVAGGHNPRPVKGQRLRNRFYCKFYYYPEQYGPTACTGCGRCVEACPVNIDIEEVIGHLLA